MAVENDHPVAKAIKSLTGSLLAFHPHSDEQYISLVFGGGYSRGRTPLQCDECQLISLERCHGHACLSATGQPRRTAAATAASGSPTTSRSISSTP